MAEAKEQNKITIQKRFRIEEFFQIVDEAVSQNYKNYRNFLLETDYPHVRHGEEGYEIKIMPVDFIPVRALKWDYLIGDPIKDVPNYRDFVFATGEYKWHCKDFSYLLKSRLTSPINYDVKLFRAVKVGYESFPVKIEEVTKDKLTTETSWLEETLNLSLKYDVVNLTKVSVEDDPVASYILNKLLA